MAKTLVVKLAGTVDNDDLRKLGEIRMQIVPVSSLPSPYTLTEGTQRIELSTNKPIQLETTGSVHFTDSTLTQNLGTTATTAGTGSNEGFFLSDGEGTLHIYDKYSITRIASSPLGSHYAWTLDVRDFEGCAANLRYLGLSNLNVASSDLSPLSGLTNLNYININSVYNVDVDISLFSGSTSMTSLTLNNVRVTHGDIASLSGLTNLTSLGLGYASGVHGDIASLSGLTNLTSLTVLNTRVTGDTSSIANLHPNNGGKLATFRYENTGITGEWPPATA